MREFIGVRSIKDSQHTSFPEAPLKRQALIFDRIAIYKLKRDRYYATPEEREMAAEIEAAIDELTEKGFFLQYESVSDEEKASLAKVEEYRKSSEAASHYLRSYFEIPFAEKAKDPDKLRQGIERLERSDEYLVRLTCIELRLLKGLSAYPISDSFMTLAEGKATNSEVVNIVFKALPVPDESVSWDRIYDYRRDPESRSKFLALRNWMGEVARAELTPAEVEEKLEYLLDQYQKHMSLHRMKTNTGMLETVVTTGAEMLGDFFSFKWGKAAQALFSLKKRQVALLEGELTAPGNEVAYIVKARETFGGG